MEEVQDQNQKYIPNNIPDYQPEIFNPDLSYQALAKILIELLKQYFKNVDPNSSIALSSSIQKNRELLDFYDGVGGNFYVLLKLAKFLKKLEFEPNIHLEIVNQMLNYKKLITMMQTSNDLLRKNKKKLQNEISFYFGYSGLLSLEAEKYYLLQDKDNFFQAISEIIEIKESIKKSPESFEYEVLYGIPGFLQILLNLQNQFQFNDNMNTSYKIQLEEHVFDIVEILLNYGLKFERNKQYNLNDEEFQKFVEKLPNFRLHYRFYKQEYLGAAHGLSGTLYMLTKALLINKQEFEKQKPQLQQKALYYTKLSLKYLLQCQNPNGNFPIITQSKQSDLVQFCHGSPGVIPCLIAGKQLFINDKIFQEQIQNSLDLAVNHSWKYGILKKGFGLCHGITGTAYSFLQLYKCTQNDEYFYQAMQLVLTSYTDFTIQNTIKNYNHSERFSIGQCDYPFGLMNGIGGEICLLIDLFNPSASKFPGFEI